MDIDRIIIENINQYISANDISPSKLAKESGMSYHKLWLILNKNYSIRVGDYYSICRAVKEPLDFFMPKA